ncbi:PfkB family carbohydrate kinase [Bombilactobacillus bombi]|uniref:PfkB family carbohydrate kinase n=1 Tax=Bombilactobacillus bombi TaxID=1303590 RepID=UPI0015FBE5F3|nr:PfkB family carbohydrate kinase [Bombilactobacillus bombi]
MSVTKRFLLAQDWSSWGDISLQTASALFQLWGLPTVSLPVKLLAAHTGWDKQAPSIDLNAWVQQTLDHWQMVQWSGIYLGYLGSNSLIDLWLSYLKQQSCPIILDPAMADHGKLYHGLSAHYVDRQKQLLPLVDVLTPNLTEAQLLVGFPITDADTLKQALQSLAQQLRGHHVVITSVAYKNQLGCAYLDGQKTRLILQPRQPRQLFGSGDLFTSLLAIFIFTGAPFETAVVQATKLTTLALQRTALTSRDIQIATIIPDLLRLRDDNHE